ncbi:MAG: hypothetical protein IJ056_07970 [Acidaminococcaceae bacterium]|nr:hypothetical protein [Acidaminococcaceae bacterium]MBR1590316.1 hypothetical protein [Acidaminococcaceae bacterium]
MRKFFSLLLLSMCILLGAVTAFAGLNGETLRPDTLPAGMTAAETLQKYHACITHKEMKKAWNLLGADYQKSFGSFTEFCKGFETTVSSEVTDITPVADGPNMTALEYKLTAKDSTKETNVVQVFKGSAELEFFEGRGWKIMSARNELVDTYFPPKW